MNVLELKNELHRLVVNTDDERILEKIKDLFQNLRQEADWWESLSEKERALIKKGRAELDEGKGVAYAEVQQQALNILQKN